MIAGILKAGPSPGQVTAREEGMAPRSIHSKPTLRFGVYGGLIVAMVAASQWVAASSWRGTAGLHSGIELAAVMLAVFAGIMALVRHHSRREPIFLFLGAGLLSAALMDAYHLLVTIDVVAAYLPQRFQPLQLWSWVVSRSFLGFWVLASLWVAARSDRQPDYVISDRRVYWAAFLIGNFFLVLFAIAPLPAGYYPDSPARWIEGYFIGGVFVVALAGYLWRGGWRRGTTEHWLVVSLLIAVSSQVLFMTRSTAPYDAPFMAAHIGQVLGYGVLLVGLIAASFRFLRRLSREEKERAVAERALRRLTARQQLILDTAPVGIVFAREGNFVRANQHFETLYGWSRDDLAGQSLARLFPSAKDCQAFLDHAMPALKSGKTFSTECMMKREDGTEFWAHMVGSAIESASPEQGVIWIGQDITVRRKLEEALRREAYYDTLTGLPNRKLFADRLEQSMALARRERRRIALLFIDLDGFKAINDGFGHRVGDELLCDVGIRLRGVFRETDTVARFAGDEFTVLLGQVDSMADVELICTRALSELTFNLVREGKDIPVSASVGIAIYPNDADDADTLIRAADFAMYHAKSLGRSRFSYFETTAAN